VMKRHEQRPSHPVELKNLPGNPVIPVNIVFL
jgi:hypothetical protein